MFPAKETCGSFIGRFRDEFLNENWFKDLSEVRRVARTWPGAYNHNRPHGSPGGPPPAEYARRWAELPFFLTASAQPSDNKAVTPVSTELLA